MFFMAIEDEQSRTKLEQMYYEYRVLMYKIAFEILGDKALAEDAVSESFVRIINNLHKIDEIKCPQTRNFLVIICRNVAIDIYNSHKPIKYAQELDENTVNEKEEFSNPLDIVVSKENVEKIARAIEELDPIYRDVLILKRVYGMSRGEIADKMGVSVETVKKRLTRATAKLKEILVKEGIR